MFYKLKIITNQAYQKLQLKTPDNWDDILSDLHCKNSIIDDSAQYTSRIVHSPHKSNTPIKHHNHLQLVRKALAPYPQQYRGLTKDAFFKSNTNENFTDWQKNQVLLQNQNDYTFNSFLQSSHRNQIQVKMVKLN